MNRISNWIDSHFPFEWAYGILAILSFAGAIVFLIAKSMPWWACIIVPPIMAWVLPIGIIYAVLMPIMSLGYLIWGVLHPIKAWKKIFPFLAVITFLAVGYFASAGIVRVCASLFAKPDSSNWEYVYVSESPHARKYHHDTECKFLNQSSYDYNLMSVVDAEYDYDLEPCKYCLQKNLKHQYDNLIVPVSIAVYILLFLLIKQIDKYTFRSPIVKKKTNEIQQP